jgi:hypothetical protein
MDIHETKSDVADVERDSSAVDATPAWEMIESGRYQPRRIRGSYRGRELG